MISIIFPLENVLKKAENSFFKLPPATCTFKTLKPNLLPSQSNDSHSSFDQKIEIWNSECGMTIAMNMRMKSRNPVWHFFARVGGKGKGGKFVLCDAKLVCQSMENYFQPPLV